MCRAPWEFVDGSSDITSIELQENEFADEKHVVVAHRVTLSAALGLFSCVVGITRSESGYSLRASASMGPRYMGATWALHGRFLGLGTVILLGKRSRSKLTKGWPEVGGPARDDF